MQAKPAAGSSRGLPPAGFARYAGETCGRVVLPDLAIAATAVRLGVPLLTTDSHFGRGSDLAATALVHELPLVTRNEGHFRRVPDLRVLGYGD